MRKKLNHFPNKQLYQYIVEFESTSLLKDNFYNHLLEQNFDTTDAYFICSYSFINKSNPANLIKFWQELVYGSDDYSNADQFLTIINKNNRSLPIDINTLDYLAYQQQCLFPDTIEQILIQTNIHNTEEILINLDKSRLVQSLYTYINTHYHEKIDTFLDNLFIKINNPGVEEFNCLKSNTEKLILDLNLPTSSCQSKLRI